MCFAEQLIELGVVQHAFGERAIPEQANMESGAQANKRSFKLKITFGFFGSPNFISLPLSR
jgi:hypothetical protein